MTCLHPTCGWRLSKAALEGGQIFRARYVRVTKAGRILLACPKCGTELALMTDGKMPLPQRTAQRKAA